MPAEMQHKDEDHLSLSGQQAFAERIQAADFDAASFLNDALPALNISSHANATKQSRNAQLQIAATEAQSLLNQLNAHNIRTSSELSRLADEMLRSANRLAYEVEVLRGDANNLHDVLSDALREDIKYFVHEVEWNGSEVGTLTQAQTEPDGKAKVDGSKSSDPKFMQELRLLGHIKSRLESVTKVFDEAMKWPVVPSEISMASSLISVSAPELGVASSVEDDKARAVIKQFRDEIVDLLKSDGGGHAGLEAASKRVAEFQSLVVLWKGTIEERARNRTVDNFARLVDDKKKQLDGQSRFHRVGTEGVSTSGVPSRSGTPSGGRAGLFGGLRKLRDEIYLD